MLRVSCKRTFGLSSLLIMALTIAILFKYRKSNAIEDGRSQGTQPLAGVRLPMILLM